MSKQLRASRWQVGLHGSAKSVPIGLAFQRGITATVFTFAPEGVLRINIPCRNRAFLERIGGDFQINGTWKILPTGAVEVTQEFRGEKKTSVYGVSFLEGDLLLAPTEGWPLRLGRFDGDLSAECVLE